MFECVVVDQWWIILSFYWLNIDCDCDAMPCYTTQDYVFYNGGIIMTVIEDGLIQTTPGSNIAPEWQQCKSITAVRHFECDPAVMSKASHPLFS